MARNDDSSLFENMGQGCAVHGDEHMRECTMCGAEFCRLCHPRSSVCPDCAESPDESDDPDFDDVKNLDELLDEDEDADKDDESGEDDDETDDLPPKKKGRRRR